MMTGGHETQQTKHEHGKRQQQLLTKREQGQLHENHIRQPNYCKNKKTNALHEYNKNYMGPTRGRNISNIAVQHTNATEDLTQSHYSCAEAQNTTQE